MPIGYHGRASSIIPTGVHIHRPNGQRKGPQDEWPSFGPSLKLDFELEMAFIVGKESRLGRPVKVEKAEEYIFGFVLFNDWSARDIQQWEYVPLGPFLGKNFASSISPWIVTLEALEFARVPGPQQEPIPMPYLHQQGSDSNFDIQLEVHVQTAQGVQQQLVQSNFKHMYWSVKQQLAHHTVNGCNLQVGDMYASGTISGPDKQSFGSMLELSWNGKEPIVLPDGSVRSFIEDGDTITMRGYADKNGIRVGFGEVSTKVLSAMDYVNES
jgi:fumarylacetoacetase